MNETQNKIWLVGANGMLGRELQQTFDNAGILWVGSDMECDITDYNAVKSFVQQHNPGWIVNCAAYTAVDKAETDEDLAMKINAEGPKNLALCATESHAALIHISTDYVFDGLKEGAYVEDDMVCPASAYGRTKETGERMVREHCTAHYILRTSWLYGRYGKNFVYTMIRLMREKPEIRVVADQWGSPTWAADLANTIIHLVTTQSRAYGTYHFSNEGRTNWYEFALAIRDLAYSKGLLTVKTLVTGITTAEYPTPAKRPANSLMSKEKIKTLGIVVPEWRESLRAFIDLIDEQDCAGK